MFRQALVLLPCLAFPAFAQDMRTVHEPTFPATCSALVANLAPGEETVLDTGRIQNALDHCAPGRAVELKPDGPRTAFLSGPLDFAPASP